MKRSEMINYIKADLQDKLEMLKRGKAEYVAGEILDMLEGFGMLPPFKFDIHWAQFAQSDLEFCRWEDEGEENEL